MSLCWHFFSRHDMCWFFSWLVSSKPFQIPPTTDCQQRRSTRAGILAHRAHRLRIVLYRIGRHVQSILKLLGPDPSMPNPQHDVSVSRFREPYAQSRHTTPRGTHRNETDSLGIRLAYLGAAVVSFGHCNGDTNMEEGGAKMRDVLVLQRNFGHQPSNIEKICSIR